MRFIAAFFLTFTLLSFPETLLSAEETLYEYFEGMNNIHIAVQAIQDADTSVKVDVVDLKRKLEDALANRRSLNFNVVDEGDAKFLIHVKILEFIWLEEDPVDKITGLVPAAIDALTKEHYARLQVVFAIKEAETKTLLLEKKLKATLTDKDMTEEESIPLVNDRIVQIFMRKCFSKTRAGHR